MNNLIFYSLLKSKEWDKITTFAKHFITFKFKRKFMNRTMKYFRFLFTFSVILITTSISYIYSQKPFTIVIDAGHGGHDTGAVGNYSKEKNINLAVAKLLGEKIQNNYPDVKVVYTRTTDVFLPLQERADIVNRNNADIFFCIHTNATKGSTAFGTETYTLGLAKSQANLDVAMRENAVITLEDDYKTKYKGFDPRSVDSYIMFEFMQDKYIDRSVQLASSIQNQFVRSKRYDRGVRQAGFWVLHRSACPSVLIEMGFISNPMEEQYLSSNEGRQEIADAIYNAFTEYKRDNDKKNGLQVKAIKVNNTSAPSIENEDVTDSSANKQITSTIKEQKDEIKQDKPVQSISNSEKKISKNVIFKIQLFAVDRKMKHGASEFKGLKDTDYFREGKLYKYTYGEETDFKKIEKLRKGISKKFPQAYVVAFKNGEKISVREAMKK